MFRSREQDILNRVSIIKEELQHEFDTKLKTLETEYKDLIKELNKRIERRDNLIEKLKQELGATENISTAPDFDNINRIKQFRTLDIPSRKIAIVDNVFTMIEKSI